LKSAAHEGRRDPGPSLGHTGPAPATGRGCCHAATGRGCCHAAQARTVPLSDRPRPANWVCLFVAGRPRGGRRGREVRARAGFLPAAVGAEAPCGADSEDARPALSRRAPFDSTIPRTQPPASLRIMMMTAGNYNPPPNRPADTGSYLLE
jgi:hypothetical protein